MPFWLQVGCPSGCPVGYQCRNGACVCRTECPQTDNSQFLLEVCGTDGHFYKSECDLKREACLMQKTIKIDPTGEACRINKQKQRFPVEMEEKRSHVNTSQQIKAENKSDILLSEPMAVKNERSPNSELQAGRFAFFPL
ncbi:unnamed protein product [Protopolystoma xenopodis]|uniref:Kazal-like domain-containing protein n=1 Tax=Protopolystoma xenopodis TaxID=117903 RepID=A0A448X8Y6_9PLAT|nr:unnamed protein product [Protopolystoma xenopodis]